MVECEFKAVVIGTSSGGLQALTTVLKRLPKEFPPSIIIICHRLPTPDTYLTEYLNSICQVEVRDAENLSPISPNAIYIAPPEYHLLIADDLTFNLTQDPLVNASRPSIDITFETAAETYAEKLIGIILTGANNDGAIGLQKIKNLGGYTMVQNPNSATAAIMPEAALKLVEPDFVGSLEEIACHLCQLFGLEVVNYVSKNKREE